MQRLRIVSPALAAENNGNWHTAARWQGFIAPLVDVDVALDWHGEPLDALIALHARRSAESIARFHASDRQRPIALVLTGTDLYRDLAGGDLAARHSLECASHVVVLQDAALLRLAPELRRKARVIVQSAKALIEPAKPERRDRFVAVGHLRDEKDPLTLMRAARLLPQSARFRIEHVGAALDARLGGAALATAAECATYRWLGALPHGEARRRIACAHALVHMSRMEGGANVVIEAVRSRVPVLASRIDGNLGLLGADYDGFFEVGDERGLAASIERFANDAAFAARLAEQCERRAPLFAPEAEAAAVRRLVSELLHAPLDRCER